MSESPTVEDRTELPKNLAQASFVSGLIGFLSGVAGVPGIALLVIGAVALVTGFFALKKGARKPVANWTLWVTAVTGIVLGGFCLMVGLFQPFLQEHAITKAKKTTTLATTTAIESAVNNIYTEYGAIPKVGSRVTTNSPEGLTLLNILLGLDAKSDGALNSRAIKFLAVREGKNKKNGLIYAADGKSIEGLYDSWGSPYTIELDTDYNEQLRFTIGSEDIDLRGRRVAVISPGLDRKLGTADDVKTW